MLLFAVGELTNPEHRWQTHWGMWLYLVGWVVLLPLGGGILLAWGLIEARRGSLERSWPRMLFGLAVVGMPPILFIMAVEGEAGVGLACIQWLSLLLPRLVVPGLRRGAFRAPG